MKLVIQGGILVNTEGNIRGKYDILIENGKISEIGVDLDITDSQVIEAEGMYILPGLIDAHCHLREPGYEYKEDIETGTKSAAIGGFTSIACMPNTKPAIDNASVINYILERVKNDGVVNVYPIGAITKEQKGKELAEIGEMKFAGAVAVSDDGHSVDDPALMKKALQYASMFDIPVISHCEDSRLAEDGSMNEGEISTRLGLRGISTAVEDVIVSRDVILAEYLGVPIHIAHVSTSGSVEIIRQAKKRGVKVTAETCPHYFTLTEEACLGYNTNAKMNPPLRTKEHVDAVIKGLSDGTIDIIATDHAPHHKDEKEVEFENALNGIVGFETAFSLAVTYLVKPGYLSLSELVYKMSRKPAIILGLDKGTINMGRTADITIVDMDDSWVVNVDEFLSKGKNSPYNNWELQGRIKHTIVGGKIVVSEGRLV